MKPRRGWLCAVVSLLCAGLVMGAPQAQKGSDTAQRTKAAETPAAQPTGDTAKVPAPDEAGAATLPVRRVVLYKTGVGYFEHVGHVRGNQTMRIDFTSGQLNDVLQSLTVLDLNGGRIAGVNYNSEAPLQQRLGTLRLPLDERTDVSKFYGALRGARLEVRNGTTSVTGRLLSVERKTRVSGGTTLEVDLITLVSDTGEVHSVEVTPAVSVRLAEQDVTREVGRYLSLLASVRQQDLRRMTIATAGTGERQLYVSYISEVPIWKTSYRIVLPSKPAEQPLLQGWAIVDNTVGEDWDNVELSLVAGAPHSFIEQLSQPYYARRPVVPLPENAQVSPQTHESAMEAGSGALSGRVLDPSGAMVANAQVSLVTEAGQTVSSTTSDANGEYEFAEVPAGVYRLQIGSPGFRMMVVQGLSLGGGRSRRQDATLQVGAVSNAIVVTAAAPTLETEMGDVATDASAGPRTGSGAQLGRSRGLARGMRAGGVAGGVAGGIGAGYAPAQPMAPSANAIAEARLGLSAAAQGGELGDLFEYKLKDRVTIRKNESALVPILQAHMDVEKVSLWNASLGSARPLRALWLTNSSALTLDGGSFSVLEGEAFAGEGISEPIKPGEKRLLSYATDLGVRVEITVQGNPQRVNRVYFVKGVMYQSKELRESRTYTIRNDDTTPRTVLIEHPFRPGWMLASSAPKPEESAAGAYRFRVSVEPKKTAYLVVPERMVQTNTYQVTNITSEQIAFFLQQQSINPEVEAALRKIVEQKNRVAALEAQATKLDEEKEKIFDDQQRVRENLKALKGSAEERALTQRYMQQLNDQETRLHEIERESESVAAKKDAEQETLDDMIQKLAMDATLEP